MCILIYKPKGRIVELAMLEYCIRHNSHGVGYMFPSSGKLRIMKGLWSFHGFMAMWKKLKRQEDIPVVLHFRLATSGPIDFQNCHPHRISKDLAFAHNGTLSCVPVDRGQNSDTIEFRNQYLQGLQGDSLGDDNLFANISKAIGENNKFVFMNGEGKVAICNEDQGVWDNGLWFSNYQYQENENYAVW